MTFKFTTVIVDDEEPARQRLCRQLKSISPAIEIVGEAADGIKAVEMINRIQPDVVFLDIQMPGLDGLELISHLKKVPQIIFCTAFEEYAVKAFDINGIDYLLKPVREERLIQALEKLCRNDHRNSISGDIFNVVEQMLQMKKELPLTSLPVKVGDRIIFIALPDILYFEADEKYVNVMVRNGHKYLTDIPLNRLEEKLPKAFSRVHKSYLVNTQNIKEIRKYLNHRYILLLNDHNQTRITTGRSYAEKIKQIISL